MNKDIEKKISQIREVLARFEKADFDSKTSFHVSSGFPAGCCRDATDLLGLYLLKYYGLESDYVCGLGLGDNSDQTHAWLVCQGYIIDITADQFNDNGYELPSVIIDKQSSFHELFDETTSRPTSIEYLKGSGIPNVLAKVLTVMQGRENAL
ncbi:hypothetical protein [Vibrio vulnificus]|uniref:hypothetical protein n=1 Tax=Vibrio vulnificus TaxID=672 RepID=UPI0019D4EDA8|nr:hypothetical protein [Vibrio vulnificus]EJT0555741.1 hypothetical protein [Vibrio vulnificus]MBN8133647.1 hypothetical protein [Vibrio vulnificus]MBN8138224.1 hypothetical protein [Vibrio vulnificus]MBN8161492.1 hypothetical protein [Vibrio vulnificus]